MGFLLTAFPSLFSGPKLILIGVIGIGIALGAGYTKGRADGKAASAQAAVTATLNQLKERGITNEAVRNLDAVALCIELGGMPDDCRN